MSMQVDAAWPIDTEVGQRLRVGVTHVGVVHVVHDGMASHTRVDNVRAFSHQYVTHWKRIQTCKN